MDVVVELKKLKCDPGPVHSPHECDMQEPCPCMVQAAAADEIERLRGALADAERRAREWRNVVALNIEKSKPASPF